MGQAPQRGAAGWASSAAGLLNSGAPRLLPPSSPPAPLVLLESPHTAKMQASFTRVQGRSATACFSARRTVRRLDGGRWRRGGRDRAAKRPASGGADTPTIVLPTAPLSLNCPPQTVRSAASLKVMAFKVRRAGPAVWGTRDSRRRRLAPTALVGVGPLLPRSLPTAPRLGCRCVLQVTLKTPEGDKVVEVDADTYIMDAAEEAGAWRRRRQGAAATACPCSAHCEGAITRRSRRLPPLKPPPPVGVSLACNPQASTCPTRAARAPAPAALASSPPAPSTRATSPSWMTSRWARALCW